MQSHLDPYSNIFCLRLNDSLHLGSMVANGVSFIYSTDVY